MTPNGNIVVVNTGTNPTTFAEWDTSGAPVPQLVQPSGLLLGDDVAIAAFPDGRVGWRGWTGGMGAFAPRTGATTTSSLPATSDIELSFETGPDGSYFVGTRDGFTYRVDGVTQAVTQVGVRYNSPPFKSLTYSPNEPSVLGATTGSLTSLDPVTLATRVHANVTYGITGISADDRGYVYAAYGDTMPYRIRQFRVSDLAEVGSFVLPDASVRARLPRISGRTMYVSSYTRVWKIDIGIPVPSVSASSSTAVRGMPLTFDASATYVPFGSVTSYEWDFDGDGTYERTTATATTSAPLMRAGSRTVTVRAVADDGARTATTSVSVSPVAPGVPTGVNASAPTGTGTAVSFTAPADDGGTAISTYQVSCTSSTGGTTRTATGITSPITVADLSRGHRYTCSVSASGPGGDSASATSAPVDVPAVAPDAPTGVSASLPLSTSTDVTFVPPSTDGGSAILDYTATCRGSDGSSTSGSGSSSPIVVSNLTPGTTYTCTARARNAIGTSPASAASSPVLAFWGSPPGEVGVSINDGAQYTTTPDVTLSVAWPARATGLRVSNDGGFGNLTRFELTKTVAWKLDSSGPERLPKTVYVRFSGANVNEQQTFQDDIILDETPPVVISADAVFEEGAVATARAKGKRVRVKVRAKDSQSGIRRAQLTSRKSAPGPEVAYRSTLRTAARGSRVYLRVRDGAGNWSKWKTVRVK